MLSDRTPILFYLLRPVLLVYLLFGQALAFSWGIQFQSDPEKDQANEKPGEQQDQLESNHQGPMIQISAEGSELFRDLLNDKQLKPLRSFEELLQNPQKSILIVIGSTRTIPLEIIDTFSNKSFLNNNGAILICTRSASSPTFSHTFGCTIHSSSKETIQCRNQKDGYFGLIDCPYLQFPNLAKMTSGIVEPKLVNFYESLQSNHWSVAMNIPSYLTIEKTIRFNRDNPPIPIGTFPKNCLIKNSENRFNQFQHYPGAAGNLWKGKYLILADQNLFMNQMMIANDLQNTEFARYCIDWLKSTESSSDGFEESERDRCLFIENGEIQTKFDTLKISIPWNVMANKMIQYSNKVINELENKNFFNEKILAQFGQQRIFRTILFGLCTTIFFYGLLRFWRSTYEKSKEFSRSAPIQESVGINNQLGDRQVQLFQREQYFPFLSEQIRYRFQSLGGNPDERGKSPPIVISKDYANSTALKKDILQLWQIGFSKKIMKINRKSWNKYLQMLKNVMELSQEKIWYFQE